MARRALIASFAATNEYLFYTNTYEHVFASTHASCLISLHCATTNFVFPFTFFSLCVCVFFFSFFLQFPAFVTRRQTFYFVIFLPQAAANATQIKHATFLGWYQPPTLQPPWAALAPNLIFYLCRLTNGTTLAISLTFSGS